MESVLFSPIGTTDPISNNYDGAMLHIVRHHKPKKVVLFFSKEMMEFQDRDNRYLGCLKKLIDREQFETEIQCIFMENLKEVHLLDSFYDIFSECVSTIAKENPGNEILLNVSSGTPAMKSTLQILASLSDPTMNVRAVQVVTPEKRSNQYREIKEYFDIELEWECNCDNEEESPNRCRDSGGENFQIRIKKEIIKKHLLAYNYTAAIAVGDDLDAFLPKQVPEFLKAAKARTQLDFNLIDRLLGKSAEKNMFMPIRNEKTRILMEYVLGMDLRVKRAEYADFIRSISPALSDFQELAIETDSEIKLHQYTVVENGVRRWNKIKLQGNENLHQLLQAKYKFDFKYGPVTNDHLQAIIDGFCQDFELKKELSALRDVEMKARNLAAHEVISVTDEWMKRNTGKGAQDVMNLMKKVVKTIARVTKSQMTVPHGYWESYDQMNEFIIQQME